MKEKIKVIISCALILVCLPYLITYFFQGEKTSAATEKSEESQEIAGILAEQVPVNMKEEVLKAQAVMVRTQLAYCEKNNQEKPKALSKEEMEQLWGQKNYYEFYEKLIRAAEETEGQVITFQGEVINPAFHKVSAGYTRDGSTVYKNTPYLLSVKSEADILSEDYLKVQFFTSKEFMERQSYLIPASGIEEKPVGDIVKSIELQRDGAEYVTAMKINGTEVDVDAFLETFELPSANFFIKEMDDKVRIVTKGCGHGYGLSQYGANEMAKKEKTYEEILKYYFSGIKIEKTGKH
ncbi:MAG: SpoIID/LytB domain-containing protein [Lachnospiraceae bacterium]|nr:SpoIID/LytB domain-containing protein [Lachnospiraceae bacterium]MDD7378171.1 SpoIID/LytB domain-containing protein [Lachnospiraceae bacterium]MDY4617495.1 SpoIID/LytB domain-containing protein [Lachnospiraceae bacterium]